MKNLMTVLMLILGIGILSALEFDPDYFYSRSIIGCFTKEAVGNFEGKLNYTIEDGVVKTGLSSFDQLAKEYQITSLEQLYPYVKVPEWNDKGMYIQNIYRIKLASDDRIGQAQAALEKDPALHYAEFETINRERWLPNDPLVSQQYAHARIRSYEAWDYTLGSHDVKIAICDSGVKWNHPDLRANIWVNPAESPGMTINWDAGTISGGNGTDAGEGGNKVDDLLGWDFFSNDNNPYQNWAYNDHGTHVAGCAAAVGNNSIGGSGTSPIASIISCKGASNTQNSTGISYGYDQLKYAAELGAPVMNASWGGPGTGAYPNQIVNYCSALGALLVTAAGNDNTEHTTSYQDYPSDCTAALCVAASGATDLKASFSDFGSTIDIMAPGEGILSTIISNNGYDAYDGTSMASPIVAGVAALVKSVEPGLTAPQLRQRLMDTADYIYDVNPNYVGKLGSGRVNAFAATMFDKVPYITIEETNLQEVSGDGDGVPNPGDVVQLKASLNNYIDPYTGLSWMTATNLTATLRCNYPGVTIIDSVATYGTLTAGSSLWNNAHPFKFSTVSALPSEPIPFELRVTANPSATFPYAKSLPLSISLSLVQAGWPVNLSGASTCSPVLYNLDAQPDREVVFGDQLGNIHAKKTNGTTNLPGFPISVGSALVGSIAMGNVNSDNLWEFATSTQAGNTVLFNQAGATLWSNNAGGTLRNGPVIAKLTPSGSAKVITVTQSSILNVYNGDGTNATNFPVTLGGAVLAPPAIADLTGDGNMEIIVVTLSGTLYAIDPLTGQNIANFPVTLSGGSQNGMTIANIDADPNPEILITTSTAGYFYAINHDGSTLFQKNIGQQIKTSPVVANVDNAGSKELIVVTAPGNIFIMNPDGTNLAGMPISIGTAVECTPVVARFDGIDNAGIIFGDTNGKLHSIRKDGTESPNFPYSLGGNIKVSAAISDIDNDNDIDIVIPDNTGYYVVDIKRPAQSIEWEAYLGSWNRSGNIYQPTPNNDPVVPAAFTELHSNYPNPFNPSTTISFTLAADSPVTIEIFNQKGQLVKTLVNSSYTSGTHNVVWNGTDNNGRITSSGIYFYKMHAGRFSDTRKMIMMK
ncbi:MAG TPA: S8 family serine peptidase [Candidatus Cloacimonadota bacterium]|nr:S8 family serine peptidase [Candidatus Cloacimonadota bacterium]